MNEKIIHKLETKEKAKLSQVNKQKVANFVLVLIIVIIAAFFGKLAANKFVKSSSSLPDVSYINKGGNKFGQKNTKLCPDQAEGIIKKGGIDNEGTHHLVRKGGKDQYVYLTSSTIDLDDVTDKKVEVWGKTYAAKTAGWLMDACYLEIK